MENHIFSNNQCYLTVNDEWRDINTNKLAKPNKAIKSLYNETIDIETAKK